MYFGTYFTELDKFGKISIPFENLIFENDDLMYIYPRFDNLYNPYLHCFSNQEQEILSNLEIISKDFYFSNIYENSKILIPKTLREFIFEKDSKDIRIEGLGKYFAIYGLEKKLEKIFFKIN